MSNLRIPLLIVFAIALVGAGCKKGPVAKLTAAPAPQLQPGWTTYDAGTFTISAPPQYSTRPPGPEDMLGGTEQPSMENKTELVGGGKSEGLLFTLYNRSARPVVGEKPTGIEVKREPGYNDLASAIEEVQDSLDEKAYEKVKLPVGEAAKFKSSTKNVGGDEIHEVVYVVAHNGDMYTFTWSVTNQPIQGIESDAGPIMETLRVK
jgi:hypothetical protein